MRPDRLAVRDRILALDPVDDHTEIVRLSSHLEFAWDTTRALELALFRTFAVPSIGRLLARTGEFTQRTQHRYDDTVLLLAEILDHGYDSPRGGLALERMNAIHGRFRIRDDDYRYVLSTFVLEPHRWIDRFGWRPLTMVEREGLFHFWVAVGERMGIPAIPPTLAALTELNVAYERERFGRRDAGTEVAVATIDLFVGWYLRGPLRAVAPLGRRAVLALLDEPLLDAFGFPHPTAAERRLVEGSLLARAAIQRRLPPRRHPLRQSEVPRPTYPNSYRVEELGPPPAGV